MSYFSKDFYSGRFFKTAVLIFSKLVVQFSQLLLFVFLTRLFTKSDYGAFRQIAICFTTFLPFFLLGLPSGIIYFFNKDSEKSKIYFCISNVLFSLGIFFVIFITLLLYDIIIAEYLKQDFGIILLLFLWLWGTGTLMIGVNSLIALKKPIPSAIVSFLHSTFFIILVFSYTLLNQDFKSLIQIYSIAPFCLSIITLVYCYKSVPSGTNLDFIGFFQNSKKLLKYSIPMCFSTSIGGLNRQIPLLLCVYFLTAEEYAVFANGCLQIPLIASVISSAIAVVTPDIIENFNTHRLKDVRDLIYKVSLKTAYIILPIFLFLYVNAGEIIVFIFTDAYEMAVIPFKILLLAIPARVMYFGLIFISAGRTDLILFRSIFSLVICFLSAYLISLYNPLYSPFGFVISIYFWAIPFNLYWFKKMLKIPILNRNHILNMFLICTASLIAVYAGTVFRNFGITSLNYLILSSLVFVVIYMSFYFAYFKKVFKSLKLMVS